MRLCASVSKTSSEVFTKSYYKSRRGGYTVGGVITKMKNYDWTSRAHNNKAAGQIRTTQCPEDAEL